MVDVEPEEWLDDRPSPVAKKIFSFVFFDRNVIQINFLEEENFEIGIRIEFELISF